MPSINYDFLKQLDNYNNYKIFVETGTYRGETIFGMEKYFDELHTIEIKDEFYLSAKNRYKGNKIHFHLGDSSKVLDNLVSNLNNNTIFFLDGHWSAGDTGRGEKDCPLLEEIETIINKFKYDAVIVIDDFRLFGIGPNTTNGAEICNWEDISKDKILNIVKNRLMMEYHLPSSLHNKDRFIIYINSVSNL